MQVFGFHKKRTSRLSRLEMGSSSIQHGTPNLEKQSLLRHRSRHVPSPSVDSTTEIGEVEVSPPSSPKQHENILLPHYGMISILMR